MLKCLELCYRKTQNTSCCQSCAQLPMNSCDSYFYIFFFTEVVSCLFGSSSLCDSPKIQSAICSVSYLPQFCVMHKCYKHAFCAFIQTAEWELACDEEQDTAAHC